MVRETCALVSIFTNDGWYLYTFIVNDIEYLKGILFFFNAVFLLWILEYDVQAIRNDTEPYNNITNVSRGKYTTDVNLFYDQGFFGYCYYIEYTT